MKFCPKCRNFYDDEDLAFCQTDGVPLVRLGQSSELWAEGETAVAAKREIVRKQTHTQKIKRFSRILVTTVMMILVVTVIAMNIYLYFPTDEDEKAENISPTPKPSPTTVVEITPTPKSTATATPKKTATPVDDDREDDDKKDDDKKDDKKDDDKKDGDSGSPNGTSKDSGIVKTVSGGVVNGRATKLVQPTYPAAAKAIRASGKVNVQVTIDENGNVIAATAISGHPSLKSSAEQAARASKFNPTLLSGQKVRVSGTIVYDFQP